MFIYYYISLLVTFMWYCNTCKLYKHIIYMEIYHLIDLFHRKYILLVFGFFSNKVNPSIESEDKDDTTVVSMSDRFDWPRPWVREGGTWMDLLHHGPQSQRVCSSGYPSLGLPNYHELRIIHTWWIHHRYGGGGEREREFCKL